jgi:hypothetical protein
MTAPGQPTLTVRSTADLIAAVPYLIGFHPTESVVVVAMRGPRVVFAARGDLPDGGPPGEAQEIADYLVAVVAAQEAETVTVLGYGPPERVTPVIDAVRASFGRRSAGPVGPELVDALRITDGRYWSYICDNPGCCPPEGTPVDVSGSRFAAEATLAGQVALPDRAALIEQVAPVDGLRRLGMRQATDRAEERLVEVLEAAPPADVLGGRTLRRVGEAAVDAAMARHREGGLLTDDEVAWLSLLLAHIPVRDLAWERCDGDDWQIALWADVLRRVDPGLAAAPASLLAFVAWRSGQGALAAVALDRAFDAEPDYSMAMLLADVLHRGVPPSNLDGWPTVRRSGSGRTRPDARSAGLGPDVGGTGRGGAGGGGAGRGGEGGGGTGRGGTGRGGAGGGGTGRGSGGGGPAGRGGSAGGAGRDRALRGGSGGRRRSPNRQPRRLP